MAHLRKVNFKRLIYSKGDFRYINAEAEETGYFHKWLKESWIDGQLALIETLTGEIVKVDATSVLFLGESADPEESRGYEKAKQMSRDIAEQYGQP